jgi:hypothetical protein
MVARFGCMGCMGRGSFAQGRRALLCKLVRDLSEGQGFVNSKQ